MNRSGAFTAMPFIALDVALKAQQEMEPLLVRIKRVDRKLEEQLRKAENSVLLNLGEGQYGSGGTRRARFESACGSAGEVRAGLLGAIGWRYLSAAQASPALKNLERLLALPWKLSR